MEVVRDGKNRATSSVAMEAAGAGPVPELRSNEREVLTVPDVPGAPEQPGQDSIQTGSDDDYMAVENMPREVKALLEGMCSKCGTRKAVLDWVNDGGALAYVHGLSMRWCELCAVETQLEHARKQAARIPELEAALKALQEAS